MDYITLTKENIEQENICCVIQDKKGNCGAKKKKEWLKERFEEGLVFTKANIRGKVFIEYIPAEKAWAPIQADNYMFINCLWTAGAYKGQGHGSYLLNSCVEAARTQGKYGVVVISSVKKKPFLADSVFFKKKGFEVCDTAQPFYELLCLKFDPDNPVPKFRESAKTGTLDRKDSVVILYSNQCPYTEDYVAAVQEAAQRNGITLKAIKYISAEMAQNAPVASTSYSIFINGLFKTHEILTVDKFLKLCGKEG